MVTSHDRVRDVRAREHRLELAVLAVGAHDLRPLDGGGRVREVVGEHLVRVELGDGDLAAVGRRLGEVAGAAFHDRGGGIDSRARGGELV